ncbi:hypothetical protein HYDPIDRAFT_23026 [Hydnomerulius pinastri MD-312]|nr:hypothetical protein HYDPIDRAFT_23026 [Hydnomerulius pinastri MD-312]
MYARVIIALFALAGSAAAACQSSDYKDECCKSAGIAPNGWQGSDCTPVQAGETCAYTELCCYVEEGTSAAVCYKAN